MATAPTLRHIQANGLSLACFEWREEARGLAPSLLLIHATGFHARVWDPVVRHLPDWHIIALELRGHGRSDELPFEGWQDFGADLTAAVAALALNNAVGVGHSMGAHALVHAAARLPSTFKRLVLLDPTLFAPTDYLNVPALTDAPHPVASRKATFSSAAEMMDRFVDKVPYRVFQPEALQSYCEHGLKKSPEAGGWALACSPSTEGQIYKTARRDLSIFTSIRSLTIPVRVVRARPSDPAILPFDTLGSPTWPGIANEFKMGEDVLRSDRTHMLPMEDPALTAQLITQSPPP